MSNTIGCAGSTGDEPPCITSPLKSYARETTAQNKEGEIDRINSFNGSGDAEIGFGSPRKSENERTLSRSPRRRSPKRRSRSRSPKRRSRSRSPVSKAKMCDEMDGWERNECVILDSYNCDLNMIINSSNYGARPQTEGGFSMMWSGIRASYGFVEGKIFYEVRILENIAVDNLDSFAGGATHVVRVGWSTEDSLFALGEEHNSFGYGGTGKKSCDNKFADYGCTFSEGDVVGAFLEITENEAIMRFSVNGVDQGECYRVNKASLGTNNALFPHIYVKNVEFSVNFGQDDIEPWFAPNILGDDTSSWNLLNQTALCTRVRGRLPPSSKAECDVIMMIGLPGAGKTYYADKLSNENRKKQYNILGTNFILDRMKVIGLARQRNYAGRWDVLIDKATKCLNILINVASSRRRNYILDQTNVYPSAQRRKMRPFEGFKRRAIVIVPTDEEFRRRIAQREKEEGKEVPESAVLEMKANFGIPKAISEDSSSVFDEVEFTELDASAAGTLVERYNEEGQAGRPPPEKRQRWEGRDRDSGDSRWGGGGGGFDRDRSRDFSRGRRDGFSRSPRRDDRGRRDYRGGYSAQRDGREDRFDRGRDRDSYGRGRFGGGAPSGRFGGPPPPRGGGYAPNMRGGGGYGGGFDGGMGRGGMNRGGGNYGYGYDMNRGPPVDFRGGPRGGRGGYHGGGGSMDPMYRGGPPSFGGPGGANDQSYEGAAYSGYPSHSGRGGPIDSQSSGRGTTLPPSRGMGAPGRGAPPVGRGGGGGSRGSQDPYGGGAGGYTSSTANYPPVGRSQFPGQGESYSGGNQKVGGGYPTRPNYSEGGYQKGAYPDEYSSASASGFSSACGYAEGAYPPGTNPPSSFPPQESYSNAGGTRGGRAAPIPPSGMFGGAGESLESAKSVRSGGQSAENQAAENVNQHASSASRFGGDRQGGVRQSRFDDVKATGAQNMYQQQNPYSYPSGGYQSTHNVGGYGSSSVAPPSKGAPPTNQPPPSKSNRSQFEPAPPTVNPGPLSQQSMATQGYGYGYQQSKPESTNQAPAKQPQPSSGVNPTANYNSAYGYGYTYGGYGGSGGVGAAASTGASRTPPSSASANAVGPASLYASAVADKTTTQAQSMTGSNAAQKQAAAPGGGASAASMAYASYYGYGQAGVQPPHPSGGAQAIQQQQQQQQQYSAWQQSTGASTAAAPAAASVPTTTSPASGQAAAAAAAASAYSSYYAAYPGYAAATAYGRPSGGASAGSTVPAQQQQQQQQQQYYAGYR